MSNYIEKITIGDKEYDVCDKEARSDNLRNSLHIDTIEKRLDLAALFTTLSSAETNTITVPAGVASYAKITKIYGRFCQSNRYRWFMEYERNTPTRIMLDNGTVIEIPEFESYHEEDYIFFEGGKAYFHKGTRWASYNDWESELGEGEAYLDQTGEDGGTLIKLAEPIITDISDTFDFDGLLDLTGATKITVEHRWNSKAELQAYVDECKEEDANGDCVYACGGIVVEFEVL